ncbi:DUF4870 domain-containing protein [Kocuria soli]|nr:DUF4870 domain-containing protein [Kocuria soli]
MTTDDSDRSASHDDGAAGPVQDPSGSEPGAGPGAGSDANGSSATTSQYGQQPGYQPGGPQSGQPQYGAGQYGAPETSAPQYGAPQNGAPQYGAPQNDGAQYGAPGHGYGQQPNYGQQAYGQQPNYGGAPNPGGPYQFSGMPPQEARTMALVTHLSAPVLYLLSAGWAGFLAPLILWAIYKDKDPLVRQAGAGSFNFNFALMVVSVVAWIAGFVSLGLLIPLTILVVFAVLVVQVIFGIFGAMAANQGQAYKYPFEIPILK